jgi:hypothetical protein
MTYNNRRIRKDKLPKKKIIGLYTVNIDVVFGSVIHKSIIFHQEVIGLTVASLEE